jgi:hypothetical protein
MTERITEIGPSPLKGTSQQKDGYYAS